MGIDFLIMGWSISGMLVLDVMRVCLRDVMSVLNMMGVLMWGTSILINVLMVLGNGLSGTNVRVSVRHNISILTICIHILLIQGAIDVGVGYDIIVLILWIYVLGVQDVTVGRPKVCVLAIGINILLIQGIFMSGVHENIIVLILWVYVLMTQDIVMCRPKGCIRTRHSVGVLAIRINILLIQGICVVLTKRIYTWIALEVVLRSEIQVCIWCGVLSPRSHYVHFSCPLVLVHVHRDKRICKGQWLGHNIHIVGIKCHMGYHGFLWCLSHGDSDKFLYWIGMARWRCHLSLALGSIVIRWPYNHVDIYHGGKPSTILQEFHEVALCICINHLI